MDLTGRLVLGTDELVFGYDAATLDDSLDADPQEAPLANRIGVIGINALAAPRRLTMSGLWTAVPGYRAALTVYRIGDVVLGTVDDGYVYQCAQAGTTAAGGDPTWATTVTDGSVIWERRTSLWEALRWTRDTFLLWLGRGIVKLYLDDERYLFAQCISKSMPNWDGNRVAIEWTATFSCHDPRWYDETLVTTSAALAGGYTLWTPGAAITVADTCVPTLGNAKYYTASAAGTTGDTEPPFGLAGPYDDDGSAIVWESSIPKVLGNRVIPTAAHTCWYEATGAVGTKMTGTGEPTWPTTPGDTVVDNEVTWTCRAMPVWALGGDVTETTASAIVTNAGTAETSPVIRLTIPVAALAITINNATTDQTCTITGTPDVAGVLEIDCHEGTVRIGDADHMRLFDGEFPSLAVGENAFAVSWFDPGPSVVSFLHRDQYW